MKNANLAMASLMAAATSIQATGEMMSRALSHQNPKKKIKPNKSMASAKKSKQKIAKASKKRNRK